MSQHASGVDRDMLYGSKNDMERWQQIESLFQAALERPEAERLPFLRQASAGDSELRREVESLLANHQARSNSEPWAAAAAKQLIHSQGSLEPGQSLGPYRITSFIAAGGMGAVYRAHDPRTGRDVAIKVAGQRFSERFSREVRAVAALNHPNICTLFDVGPNYLVMELVEGESPKGPLPPEIALNYARQIADALEAAHEKDIVHRDLKPGNIKIKPDGTVKVLDFGLAQISGGPGVPSHDSPTITMDPTRAGVILGTAAYMSPEQARGKQVDKRADIWAFGVVLCEMLTGRRLFEGETVSDTLAAVIKEQPDLSTLPPQLKPAIERCLSKDPRTRWRDISDVKWALDQPPHRQPESEQAKPNRLVSFATAVLIALIAGALGTWFLKPATKVDLPLLQMEINAPPGTAFGPYAVGELKISPDGRYLVFFAKSKDGKRMLWLRSLDSNVVTPLTGSEGSTTLPFWSPDSQWIAFLANGKLQKVNVVGGPPQVICDLVAPAFTYTLGTWNSDGVILLTQPSVGIQRVAASGGGKPAAVLQLDSGSGEADQIDPFFLPDGNHFLYSSYGSGGGPSFNQGLHLASLDGRVNRLLIPGSNLGAYVSGPSGNGWILYTGAQPGLLTRPFDVRKGEFTGEPVVIVDGVGTGPSWSASNNGFLAFRRDAFPQSQLVWISRDGTTAGNIGNAGPIGFPRISPNQQTVAFTRTDQRTSDIWLFDATTNLTRRFSFEGGIFPVWSFDDARIVYYSPRSDSVVERRANGTGGETILIKGRAFLNDMSRDGHWLLSLGKDLGHIEIWARGTSDKPVSVLEGQQPSISPDGRWLLYTVNSTGRSEVLVRSVPKEVGGTAYADFKSQVSTNGGSHPMWRSDGKEIFYLAPDSTMMAVPVESSENGFRVTASPKALFATRLRFDEFDRQYDVTADGKRFLLNQPLPDSTETPITVIVNWPKLLERK